MKKNDMRHILGAAAQTVLSGALLPIVLSGGGPVSPGLRVAGIAVCACLFLLSVFRLRDAILLYRLAASIREGIDGIVSGNYALRFHTGTCASMDEVVFGINRLTEILETARAESIRSEASRKSLLSDISHDIRTPLTSIIGYIGALKDDIASDGAERDAYIGILDAKSRALKSMVEDIFQLAKLDADEITMNPECLDVCELARESLIEFLPEINSAGIELVTAIPDGPMTVVADKMSVGRIVRNLVQNALQHGTDNGYLRIAVTAADVPTAADAPATAKVPANADGTPVAEVPAGAERPVSISVADRGRGIPAEDIPRVFTRLYRRDAARGSASGGSGLGLAIAQSLALKNGATINVSSVPGGETVFKVEFGPARRDLRKS